MGKTREKPAAVPDPAETPLYTLWDAARYLRVPPWAALSLTGRFRDWPEPEFFFHHFRRGLLHPWVFEDDLGFADDLRDRERLTFGRFAELFVRAGAFQVLAGWAGEKDRGSRDHRENLYHAVWRWLEDTRREAVPFNDAPAGGRAEALLGAYAGRMNEPQLSLLRKWLTLRLERVEVRGGQPVRIFPFSRDPAENSPRVIALDPLVRFGRPMLVERGVPTDSIFERHQAGDSAADLAEDYDVPVAEVEEAVRYESALPTPLFPFYGW